MRGCEFFFGFGFLFFFFFFCLEGRVLWVSLVVLVVVLGLIGMEVIEY